MTAFSNTLSLDNCTEFPELKPESISILGLEYARFSVSEDQREAIYRAELKGCRIAVKLNSDGTAQIGAISNTIYPRHYEYIEFIPLPFTAQNFIERYKEFLDIFNEQYISSMEALNGNLPERQTVDMEQQALGLTDEEAALLETAYALEGDYKKAAETLVGVIGDATKTDLVLNSLLEKLSSFGTEADNRRLSGSVGWGWRGGCA